MQDSIQIEWSTPFARIEPRQGVAWLLIAILAVLAAGLTLERFKLRDEERKTTANRLEYFCPVTAAVGIAVMLTRSETRAWPLWDLPGWAAALSVLLGVLFWQSLVMPIWMIRFVRTTEEALAKGLPRVPIAVRAQFLWLKLAAFLIIGFLVWAHVLQPVEHAWLLDALFVAPSLPVWIHAAPMFFRPKEGMKAALDQHDAGRALAGPKPQWAKGLDGKDTSRPLTDAELKELKAAFEKGFPPDVATHWGWTMPITAAANGDLPLLELCLGYGADVNRTNSLGRTGLFYAARYGNLAMVDRLLEAGALADFTKPVLDGSPLIAAALNGHLAVVERLIAAGADLDRRDSKGMDALAAAECNGHGAAAAALRRARLGRTSQHRPKAK